MSPERSDWLADGIVLICSSGVNISGVCDLALGAGLDAVDLGVSKVLQLSHAELVSQDVDASVLKKLAAGGVDIWCCWIVDETV